MTFMNLSREDVQVIQCNATNKHGYIFANAYLNVLSKYQCSFTECDTFINVHATVTFVFCKIDLNCLR